jgi:Protein of unknown function (DUF3048) N-terminal domain/Protein of unknown function (DUF3048) C-terminal domain
MKTPTYTRRLSLFGLLFSAIVVSACGGGSSQSEETTTTTPPTTSTTIATTTTVPETTTTTIPVPVMPLTGLPVVDEAAAIRPAIVAKIDNHPGARPQSGLNNADIVYEENVEKWTRFAVVFHTNGSDPVGPLRSGRTQDIDLLTSLNRPLLLWSGGNAAVTTAINKSELVNMSASAAGNGGGFYRSTDKKAPHNLYSKTTNIWALDAGRGGTPPPQFTYRSAADTASGTDIAGLKLTMDGSMRAAWQWDASLSKFLRFHEAKIHTDADGNQVAFDNVVVIVCDYKASPADPRSPEAQTVGSGVAWVFSAGKLVEGTWSRADNHSPWTLTDSSGAEIGLTAGRTWVELVREEQAVVVPAGQTLDAIAWP